MRHSSTLSTAPILYLLHFSKPFIVECDAFGSGIGAILHKGVGSLAFFSRAMTPLHAGLVAYESELIGLVQAVRHWRLYLWEGCLLSVQTTTFLNFSWTSVSTVPQHHWVSKLMGFHFVVEYKPGRMNVAFHDADE